MSNIQDPLLAKHLGPQIAEGASIHESCQIENGAQIGPEAVLEAGVSVGKMTTVSGQVHIEPDVTVHAFTTLLGPLHIGAGSIIGPGAIIGLCQADTDSRQTRLMEACRVGRAAQILRGLQVGRHARIRAGSLVTGDVPHYGLAAQNPAILEGFACPFCGDLLTQARQEGKEIEAHCESCGFDEHRFTHKFRADSINRVLLPYQTFGESVRPFGVPRGWQDEEEIEIRS